MRDLSELGTIATGLDHPESVTVGPDGTLYAGGEAGQIYRVREGAEPEEIANTGGFVLGLCCDATGAIYACDLVHAKVLRIDTSGAISTWCESAGGGPLVCPNYNAFAADGSMWLTDSGSEFPAPPDGRLLRIPAGGGDAEVIDLPPLRFPNGLAVEADGSVLVIESFHRPGIVRWRDGALEQVADLPRTVPDGIVATEGGAIYVTCFQPNAVLRIPPGASTAEPYLEDWSGTQLLTPTNGVFYGEGRRRLALASLAGYSIWTIDTDDVGAPLLYP